MMAAAFHDPTPGFERDLLIRKPSFFTGETFLLGKDGKARKLEVPEDAEPTLHRQWLTVQLRGAWTAGGRTYAGGSLLAMDLAAFLAGKRDFTVLFKPTASTSLQSAQWTRNHLILETMEDVRVHLALLTPGPGAWKRQPLAGAPALGTVSASPVDETESDDYFLHATDFLTPDSLSLGRPGQQPERLKALPAFFDASGLEISQHFTTSKDGTRIPYFQVAPKGMVLDGSHPTLLTGYGGFEVSELPYYSGGMGRAWLSGGGVHPGHARKMFARMQEMGHDVLYFENTEGGHGSGADNRQSAHFNALAFTFLYTTLK